MPAFSAAFSSAFDAVILTESTGEAPCSWPINHSACGGVPCEALTSLPASGQAAFEEMASTYLWNWTNQQYSLCDVVLRPCKQGCWESGVSTFWGFGGPAAQIAGQGNLGGRAPFTPVLINGQFFNIGCGQCGDSCGCGGSNALRLPGPVSSVSEVQINGEVLDSNSYRVDNNRLLVRTDGNRWPTCQDMDAPLGSENTWSVTYQQGKPVPVGGQIAAGLLACELAKAACGDKSCGLPQRVQSITRQGVTVAVLDAFDDIDTGHTGIWLIDSWVASVTKRPRRWRVLSPDRRQPTVGRVQTWP